MHVLASYVASLRFEFALIIWSSLAKVNFSYDQGINISALERIQSVQTQPKEQERPWDSR